MDSELDKELGSEKSCYKSAPEHAIRLAEGIHEYETMHRYAVEEKASLESSQ